MLLPGPEAHQLASTSGGCSTGSAGAWRRGAVRGSGLRTTLLGVLVWLLPVSVIALATGTVSVYTTQGLFFFGTALITFGGAYAALSFVAQQAAQTFGLAVCR